MQPKYKQSTSTTQNWNDEVYHSKTE